MYLRASADTYFKLTVSTSRYLEIYVETHGPGAGGRLGDLESLEIYLNLEIDVETNGFKVEITNPGGGGRLPRRSGRARSSGPFSGNCV